MSYAYNILVIPHLMRNPGFSFWIPTFAGMTKSGHYYAVINSRLRVIIRI